jgi:hypothetical protein
MDGGTEDERKKNLKGRKKDKRKREKKIKKSCQISNRRNIAFRNIPMDNLNDDDFVNQNFRLSRKVTVLFSSKPEQNIVTVGHALTTPNGRFGGQHGPWSLIFLLYSSYTFICITLGCLTTLN